MRQKQSAEALEQLQKAAELDPAQARYTYVYAVALHSAGRGNEAMAALKENLVRHPNDRDTLSAPISFSRENQGTSVRRWNMRNTCSGSRQIRLVLTG